MCCSTGAVVCSVLWFFRPADTEKESSALDINCVFGREQEALLSLPLHFLWRVEQHSAFDLLRMVVYDMSLGYVDLILGCAVDGYWYKKWKYPCDFDSMEASHMAASAEAGRESQSVGIVLAKQTISTIPLHFEEEYVTRTAAKRQRLQYLK